jgi:hypothetical protein
MVKRFSSNGRNWDTLSGGYRERLSRAGVTRTQYERGDNLQAARGHSGGEGHVTRRDYIDQIQAVKVKRYGDRPAFNAGRSRKAIDRHSESGQKRDLTELKAIANALDNDTEDELEDLGYEDWEDALYYK